MLSILDASHLVVIYYGRMDGLYDIQEYHDVYIYSIYLTVHDGV